MADASNLQVNFQGGQWSGWFAGRADHKNYPNALSVCINSMPTEEGAWTRRSGTRFLAPTCGGASAKLMPFTLSVNSPFMVELTHGVARLFSPALISNQRSGLLWDDQRYIVDISADKPAVVTVNAPITGTGVPIQWATGDEIEIFLNASGFQWGLAYLRRRVFRITVLNSTQFTLTDTATGANVDGSLAGWDPAFLNNALAGHVGHMLHSYPYLTSTDWDRVRGIQAATVSNDNLSTTPCDVEVFVDGTIAPQQIVLTGQVADTPPLFTQFSWAEFPFEDGPYFDAPNDGSWLTVNALSGSITITAHNATPFAATDVGRHIRILNQPQKWVAGTAYTTGQTVSWPGPNPKRDGTGNIAYVALQDSTGSQPDVSPSDWAVDNTTLYWTWAKITSVTSSSVVVATIGGDALDATASLFWVYRMGLYSDTTGWPSCGCFFGGRLWFGGAQPNRIDASQTNSIYNFGPTEVDGTVADNDGVSYIFDSDDLETVLWMKPAFYGIAAGTKKGEWVIQAGSQQDPITPTSIQAQRVTAMGCADMDPVQPGLALVFTQKWGRKAMEMLPDVFTGKFQAPNLQITAKDITVSGIKELAYQQELVPLIWERMANGSLAGCTYKRVSAFTTEDPTFAGWHTHTLGSGRAVESIAVGPNASATLDNLWLVTNNTTATAIDHNVRYVEVMQDLLDMNGSIFQSWFLDNASVPCGASVVTASGQTTLTLYGYWHLEGQTVDVWLGGLDLGPWGPVTGGQLQVSVVPSENPLLTISYLSTTFPSTTTWTAPDGVTEIWTETDYVTPAVAFSAGGTSPYSIQAFMNTNGTLNTGVNASIDWTSGKLWVDDGTTLAVYPVDGRVATAGILIASITWTGDASSLGYPFVAGPDGNLYATSENNHNMWVLTKISGDTLENTETFGTHSNTLNGIQNATSGLVGGVAQMTAIECSSNVYIVASSLDGQMFAVYNGTTMEFAGYAEDTSAQALALGPGVSNENFATVFMADYNYSGTPQSQIHLYQLTINKGAETYQTLVADAAKGPWNSGTTYSTGDEVGSANWLFRSLVDTNLNNDPVTTYGTDWDVVLNPFISQRTFATLTPGMIEQNWANNTAGMLSGTTLIYDPSDGNVILVLSVAAGSNVNFTQYLVKVRVSDGAVVWKIGISQNLTLTGARITAGILGFLTWSDTSATLWRVNTITGASETSDGGGLFDPTYAWFDGQNHDMIARLQLTSSPPTPINGTPSTTAANTWVKLLPATWWEGATLLPGSTSTVFTPTLVESVQEVWHVPIVVGKSFTSQGQRLRGLGPQETGARNGPALGKTRRSHQMAANLWNTGTAIEFGTDFASMRPADFRNASGTAAYSALQTFTGIYWAPLDDDYSFDSKLAWQVTRPFPATILQVGQFLHTQDR